MAPETDAPAGAAVALLSILEPAFDPGAPLGHAALRHAEVAALLRDRRLRQGGVASLAAQGTTEGRLAAWMRASLLTLEGAPHARLRRLVRQAFTPRAVEALRPTMQAVAHDLPDACAAAGAGPDPARVIAALLGIRPARDPQFQGWATDLGLLFGDTVARDRARIETALEGLAACADDLLAARRPGAAELRVLVTGLVSAGQDATRNQLGGALTRFLAHPAQWARPAAEPALAARAVEEVRRVRPTVPSIWRVATETFDVPGLRMPAGTFLPLCVARATTDPRVFGAGGFDIARERPAQLTCGGGVHACLGAPLARAALAEALPLLAARRRDLEAAGDVPWRPAMGIRGPPALPLRFRPPGA